MSGNLLLVHGAWHGAWCWTKTVEALGTKGIRATAIDLPGHKRGNRAGWRISFRHYIDAVCATARKLEPPIVLAGHSMGGMIITAAAEAEPELFSSLIYVTAFLPSDGENLFQLASNDEDSITLSAVKFHRLRGNATIDPSKMKDVFYHDCDPAIVAKAQQSLVPQPLRPVSTPIHTTESRWGQIPRHYVFCTEDRAITHKYQKWMVERHPCERTATLTSGHSPFLAKTDELADALAEMTN